MSVSPAGGGKLAHGLDHAAATTPVPESIEANPVIYNRVTTFIDHARWYLLCAVGVVFLLCFNGVWKIGRDAALYRGLAHSLATGQGYEWGDLAGGLVYPGYPLLLAATEQVFGTGDLAPLVVMNLMAPVILLLIYRLMRLHYPRWLAVCVTALVGFNGRFVALHNDLMTDIPFMVGVMMALYGWERLRIGVGAVGAPVDDPPSAAKPLEERRTVMWQRMTTGHARVFSIVFLLSGLCIAAAMRPMFWPVAAAWGVACLWGLWRGPVRKLYAITMAALLLVAVALIALDPRTRGFRPTGGGYEAEALRAFANAGLMVAANLRDLLGRDLLAAVTGDRYFFGFNHLLAATFILAPLLLLRRHLLWVLIVYATIAVTLLLSTVPRYYTPILPFILLAWILLSMRVAAKISRRYGAIGGEIVLAVGILLVLCTNFGRLGREIANQRWDEVGNREHWIEELEMAERLRGSVPEDARIIGPDGAPILSYFSERNVVGSRAILPTKKPVPQWPRHLAALGIGYAIFPSTLYTERESWIGDLMDKGVIVPGRVLARVNPRDSDPPMVLCEVKIIVPPDGADWRKQKATPDASTDIIQQTSPANRLEKVDRERSRRAAARRIKAEKEARAEAKERKAHAAYKADKAERAARAERRAAAERRERRERKERNEAKPTQKQPATTPAAAPTTVPVTQSVSDAFPLQNPNDQIQITNEIRMTKFE